MTKEKIKGIAGFLFGLLILGPASMALALLCWGALFKIISIMLL